MPTVVQTAHGGITVSGTGSYSGTAVFGSNVTSGNAIIVLTTFRDGTGGSFTGFSVSVTDSVSTSFTKVASGFNYFAAAVNREFASYAYAGSAPSSAADTVTVSVTGGTNGRGGAIFAFEVSGLGSLVPTSTAFGAQTTSSASPVTSATSDGSGGWVSYAPPSFIAAVQNWNAGGASSSFAASNTHFSTLLDESTNTSFSALYGIGSPTNFNSPDTFTCTLTDPSLISDVTNLGVAFGPPLLLRPRDRRPSVLDDDELPGRERRKLFAFPPAYRAAIVETALAVDIPKLATYVIAEHGNAADVVSQKYSATPAITEYGAAADRVSVPSKISEHGTAADTVSATRKGVRSIVEAAHAADAVSGRVGTSGTWNLSIVEVMDINNA